MTVLIPEAAEAAGAELGGSGAGAGESLGSKVGAPAKGTYKPSKAGGRHYGGGSSEPPAKKAPAKKAAPAPAKKAAPKAPPAPKSDGGGGKKDSGKGSGPLGRLGSMLPADTSKLVLAEFVACMVILALSPLSSGGTNDLTKKGSVDMMLKATALSFIFFILALVAAGGQTASKIAATFGGVITLGYLVSNGDVFGQIAKLFGGAREGVAGPAKTGGAIEGIAGPVISAVGGAPSASGPGGRFRIG